MLTKTYEWIKEKVINIYKRLRNVVVKNPIGSFVIGTVLLLTPFSTIMAAIAGIIIYIAMWAVIWISVFNMIWDAIKFETSTEIAAV